MPDGWPFPDPPDTPVITTAQVLTRKRPIRFVSHDTGDGVWQILCGTTNNTTDGRISSLQELLAIDATLAQLADLPLGWQAWRSQVDEAWQRGEREAGDEADDEEDDDDDE